MSTEEARMDPVGGPAPETTTETTTGTSTGTKPTDAVLADELREFGKQLEALFHTARTSTRGKEIEAQVTAAWRDMEKGVNNAINKAQSSDIKGTVTGTAQYAADEVQTGLAKGLKNLNVWLSQKRTEMEERRKAREASGAGAAKMAEDDVTDRFDSEPVFGQDLHVPIKSDPNATTEENPIADRFGENPPTM